MALNQPRLKDWLAWQKTAELPIKSTVSPPLNQWLKAGQEAFEERAAILEYEGELTRQEAERLAKQAIL